MARSHRDICGLLTNVNDIGSNLSHGATARNREMNDGGKAVAAPIDLSHLALEEANQ